MKMKTVISTVLALYFLTAVSTQEFGSFNHVDNYNVFEVKAATEISLLLKKIGTEDPQKMDERMLLNAYVQLVEGRNYRLAMLLEIQNCTEQKFLENPNECHSHKTGICFFQVYIQLWTQTSILERQFCPVLAPYEMLVELENMNNYVDQNWIAIDPNYELTKRAIGIYSSQFRLDTVMSTYFRSKLDLLMDFKVEVWISNEACINESITHEIKECEKLHCTLILETSLWDDMDHLAELNCRQNETDIENDKIL